MKDPISDMIVRIRNAAAVGKETVSLPYSKLKEAMLSSLAKEGYIEGVEKKGKGVIKTLKVKLSYVNKRPKINGLKRVSKFSARRYSSARDLKPVVGGNGISILTTSKGILSDKEAKKENIGGEVILKIW